MRSQRPGQGDKVGEKDMRDEEGQDEKDRVLEDTLEELHPVQGRRIQLAARGRIAIDPALHPAVDMLQIDRLRAGPSAPDTPPQGRDVKEREGRPGEDEKEQPGILKREGGAKEVKAPPRSHRGRGPG
jgi:hypothetical protein